MLNPGDYPYNCGAGPAPFYNKTDHVDVHANTFVFPNATAEQAHSWQGACQCWPDPKLAGPCPFKTWQDWQSYGHDLGSTISTAFDNKAVLAQAQAQLGL